MPPQQSQSPTPPVQPPPTPPIPPAPVVAPVVPPPSQAAPVQPLAASAQPVPKSKLPLIIGIVVGVFVVLAILGFVGLNYLGKSFKTTVDSQQGMGNDSETDTKATAANMNPCNVVLGRKMPNGRSYVADDLIVKGAELRNMGNGDSSLEFCELADLKVAAEAFILAIGSDDWAKAYSYLSTEGKKVSLAEKTQNWSTEYGAYTINPAAYDIAGSSEVARYAVETCRKDFSTGWSEKISSGYYRTPLINLNKAGRITTNIYLAMVKENGKWLVQGDNNALNRPSGVATGDAYSNTQGDRKSEPYACGA